MSDTREQIARVAHVKLSAFEPDLDSLSEERKELLYKRADAIMPIVRAAEEAVREECRREWQRRIEPVRKYFAHFGAMPQWEFISRRIPSIADSKERYREFCLVANGLYDQFAATPSGGEHARNTKT